MSSSRCTMKNEYRCIPLLSIYCQSSIHPSSWCEQRSSHVLPSLYSIHLQRPPTPTITSTQKAIHSHSSTSTRFPSRRISLHHLPSSLKNHFIPPLLQYTLSTIFRRCPSCCSSCVSTRVSTWSVPFLFPYRLTTADSRIDFLPFPLVTRFHATL